MLKFQLDFAERRGLSARFDPSLVDADLDLACATLDLEHPATHARLEHGLKALTQLLVEQRPNRSVAGRVEVRLPRADVFLPFVAGEQGRAVAVFLLDRLHEAAADAPHPQRQPLVA